MVHSGLNICQVSVCLSIYASSHPPCAPHLALLQLPPLRSSEIFAMGLVPNLLDSAEWLPIGLLNRGFGRILLFFPGKSADRKRGQWKGGHVKKRQKSSKSVKTNFDTIQHSSRRAENQRAANGGSDPSWLNLAFLGRPDFLSRGPQTL